MDAGSNSNIISTKVGGQEFGIFLSLDKNKFI